MRRECLDWVIPFHERHLVQILREWVSHYNASSGQASRNRRRVDDDRTPAAIGRHRVTMWLRRRSWEACTTSIAWSKRAKKGTHNGEAGRDLPS